MILRHCDIIGNEGERRQFSPHVGPECRIYFTYMNYCLLLCVFGGSASNNVTDIFPNLVKGQNGITSDQK
jgi:hypothetical protein